MLCYSSRAHGDILVPMKLQYWLDASIKKLEQASISTARLDCLVLLKDALEQNRAWLFAHPEHELDKNIITTLDEQVTRRSQHEPLAYIRGKSEFYGREFIVNRHTLQPRPETETMIELLKQVVASRQSPVASEAQCKEQETSDKRRKTTMTIVDIGTGSGCIAITVKLIYPEVSVIATDIDKKCLDTARQNAKKLGTKITFYRGNLLEPLSNIRYQISNIIILANLPYVPTHFKINSAAQHEPHHAIFGGEDGLRYYREMFDQVAGMSHKPRFVLTEALPPQHDELANIAKKADYQQISSQDFIQVFSPKKNTP